MIAIFWVTFVLFVFLSLFLILVVLIQKGRGGGLSGAFGGGGGGNTAFGAKTGDVLTVVTSVVFGLFVVLAVVLNLVAIRLPGNGSVVNVQTSSGTPAGGSSPAPSSPIPGR